MFKQVIIGMLKSCYSSILSLFLDFYFQMLERYEESMIDLETLLKIDSSNVAAKKDLQTVLKLKDEEVQSVPLYLVLLSSSTAISCNRND